MKENRVKLAMEAGGVTMGELRAALIEAYKDMYNEFTVDCIIENLLDFGFYDNYDYLTTVKTIAVLCNVSTDYLLGLSNVMNPVGN